MVLRSVASAAANTVDGARTGQHQSAGDGADRPVSATVTAGMGQAVDGSGAAISVDHDGLADAILAVLAIRAVQAVLTVDPVTAVIPCGASRSCRSTARVGSVESSRARSNSSGCIPRTAASTFRRRYSGASKATRIFTSRSGITLVSLRACRALRPSLSHNVITLRSLRTGVTGRSLGTGDS